MKVILSTSAGSQGLFLPEVGCVSWCSKDLDLKGQIAPPVQCRPLWEHALELLSRTLTRLCKGESHLIRCHITGGSEEEPPEFPMARRGQPGLPREPQRSTVCRPRTRASFPLAHWFQGHIPERWEHLQSVHICLSPIHTYISPPIFAFKNSTSIFGGNIKSLTISQNGKADFLPWLSGNIFVAFGLCWQGALWTSPHLPSGSCLSTPHRWLSWALIASIP